jgi:predicted small secreted protein
MIRKFVTLAVFTGSLAIAGCNTVKGAGEDIQSVAQCTEEMINRGEC